MFQRLHNRSIVISISLSNSVETIKTTTVIKRKNRIICNFKIIKYFILAINLKIKTSVLVFAMIIYGKIQEFVKCYPDGESNLKRPPNAY